MRSALLAGVPVDAPGTSAAKARYTPAHARPTRLPAAATTAGLTLGLMPAVFAAAPGTASAASTSTSTRIATPATVNASAGRVQTQVGISELSKVDSAGRAAATTKVLTRASRTYLAGTRVHYQVYYAKNWRTVAVGTTDSTGTLRMAIPLKGNTNVRAWVPAQGKVFGTLSRGVSTVPQLTLGQRAVREASKHYGAAYRYGSSGPSTFDCSGFSRYVFSKLGRSLPHSSAAQERAVKQVSSSSRRVGDLIFTYTGGRVTHVGIYAGNNKMWAATKTGDIVRLQTLYSRNISVGRVA